MIASIGFYRKPKERKLVGGNRGAEILKLGSIKSGKRGEVEERCQRRGRVIRRGSTERAER
jgi:hypothetical protein